MSSSHQTKQIPWEAWFDIAFRVMGLLPADFWDLSLREWRLMLDVWSRPLGAGSGDPVDQDELAILMSQFPD